MAMSILLGHRQKNFLILFCLRILFLLLPYIRISSKYWKYYLGNHNNDQNSIPFITFISPSLFCSSHIAGPGLDDWAVPSFCGAGLQRLQAGVSISFSFTHPCLQAGEGRVQGRTWTCAQHLHLPNGWVGAKVFNILNKVIICMLRMIYDWHESKAFGLMSCPPLEYSHIGYFVLHILQIVYFILHILHTVFCIYCREDLPNGLQNKAFEEISPSFRQIDPI